ncbi:MAG TPA: nickel pincer cofactor biosynthesis protein LarC [Phycisphaerae bacterium]|nr:nickel pincer cofactor biosynthesis protein LarC [Phycisphaerae bacterium]HRY67719.1 nickel pincer cofactor biosynthesis protein LarC [Phycisphaerae bacterium]HSA25171.1 nickel pincer cofactor biosynthesis protein LarC [Phycisphaerae bacterium]
MRIAYVDCFSGASGDMILASAIAAGADVERLRRDLAGLGVPGFRIEATRVCKQGFAATQLDVVVDPAVEKPHRHLKHILQIIQGGALPEQVRRRAEAIFKRLAEAEAKVHGTTVEKVHFHEVGAIDSIVDIVGACLVLDQLGVEQVHVSPIPTGSGTIACSHGRMPVPAPATVELLKGVPLAACDEIGELTTPTGAAILTTLAHAYGPMPAMTVGQIGVGAGRREGQTRPNILRLILGESAETPGGEEADEILVLETNLDDVTAETIGYVCERLLAAGAMDVFTSPITMKKNRPATLLTVLASSDLRSVVENILFSETTTFGVRVHPVRRSKLSRSITTVETEFGPIPVKVGRRSGRVVRVSPEYEDCRAAAERLGRSLMEVMEAARRAWK